MSFIPEDIFEFKGEITLAKDRYSRFGTRTIVYGKYPSNGGNKFYHTISETHLKKGIAKMEKKLKMMKDLLKLKKETP